MGVVQEVSAFATIVKPFRAKLLKMKESLERKLEVLAGELHIANARIDQIENDIKIHAQEINDTYERMLSLER